MSERFVSYSVKHKHHSQTSHLDIPKKNVCHTWLLQITFFFILPSNFQRWTLLLVVLLHNPSAKEAQNWWSDIHLKDFLVESRVVLSITAIHSGAEAAKQLHTIRLSPPCFTLTMVLFHEKLSYFYTRYKSSAYSVFILNKLNHQLQFVFTWVIFD